MTEAFSLIAAVVPPILGTTAFVGWLRLIVAPSASGKSMGRLLAGTLTPHSRTGDLRLMLFFHSRDCPKGRMMPTSVRTRPRSVHDARTGRQERIIR